MPRLDEIRLSFQKGLLDGPDPEDCPRDAASESEGFEFRRGYARAERGRLKLTTSSELIAGKRITIGVEWTQADGTVVELIVCDGVLWQVTSWSTPTFTQKCALTLGGASASRAALVVTIANGKLKNSVRVGDWFYFDADTYATGGAVDSVNDNDTEITLKAYGGSATGPGTFKLLRKLGAWGAGNAYVDHEVSFAVFNDHLYVADGYGPLHRLNTALTEFRPVGLIKPDANPTSALANDVDSGMDFDSAYKWMVAYKDADGWVGPGSAVLKAVTTVASPQRQRGDITCNDTPPPWATRRILFRTFADGDEFYRNTRDIAARSSAFAGGGPTTVTLAAESPALRLGAHVDQYAKFATSGNSYKITNNIGNALIVAEDLVTLGESATDYVTLLSEYDIDDAAISDSSSDAELDLDFEAPGGITNTDRSYNEPPPVGLKYLCKFRGNGRLAALEAGTQTRIWFSGRPPFASKTGGPEYFGENEPEYWPHYHDAGPQDGDDVKGLIEIGRKLCAPKHKSVWELYQDTSDVSLFGWGPIQGAEHVGCHAPLSIALHGGVAWWLGHVGEEIDLIRFDGIYARGFGRPRLRVLLEAIHASGFVGPPSSNATGIMAVIFGGRLYMSYGTADANNKTLRYDFRTGAFDLQPWGCGAFWVRQSDRKLVCADPAELSHAYDVLGSAQDSGANVNRKLVTGNMGFSDIEHPVHWTEIAIEVVKE